MHLEPKTVHAPEIGAVWLNSPPLSLRQLRGQVILVDFWDFTCVNCIRTLPYIREWHRRYHSLGLTVIGVHAPEFYFGRVPEILEQGIAEFDLPYPVMLDNDFTVWKAFANKYWPSKYVIDTAGYLRYSHAGEGAYQETELAIQALLLERDPGASMPLPMTPLRALDAPGAMARCLPPAPELYLGHRRGRIANVGGFVEDAVHNYVMGAGPLEDLPELGGAWHSLPDCAATAGVVRLCLIYSAAEVNAVVSPGAESGLAAITVILNGEPVPAGSRGSDLQTEPNGETIVKITRPRMYSLIRGAVFEQALLELSCAARGLQFFAFTFGSCLEGA
ncbi:MAG: redoxin domain-containing protein [Acidobacteria bacterium]|nr:redoxin domain-containing protein [Acidobacteriota bacterium]